MNKNKQELILQNLNRDDLSSLTVSKMKQFLKKIGSTYAFKNKQRYVQRISKIHDYLQFPWREDQQNVLDSFLTKDFKYFVINGIFGCGKTTLLLGMLINCIITGKHPAQDLFFISFNVCIRNELRRKLRVYGLSKKTKVRTFDSIIYEICKNYKYKYLDLPNFSGKRRFVYDLCEEIQNGTREKIPIQNQPRVLFIDETQDLEKQTLVLFQTFFDQAQIVFAGDVFQSIQKEPRESLLWYLLQQKDENIYQTYFKETPRVPRNILNTLKTTLSEYYPEFREEISTWRSSNNHSDAEIIWKRFYSYNNIFNCVEDFCQEHPQQETMILTFSSAITVKGALGDVARLRRFLSQKEYDVNKNHKSMDVEKLFLSTANSSKGLERDNVLAILTFPLERAFVNFSDDLVVNLLTVALTRARKKVVIYVPAYQDKFSRVLSLYQKCPQPNKKRIREGKTLKEYTFSDYLNIEHCVTELLRQSIISYDTRVKIKEYIKMYDTTKVFKGKPMKRPILPTEEERALIGVIIENLITSKWLGEWPGLGDYKTLKDHPMYTHCYKKIESRCQKYMKYTKNHNFHDPSQQFKGILYYSQSHIAMYNKIFITLSDKFVSNIQEYWKVLCPRVNEFRPKSGKINVQTNLRMPWLTGIADVVVCKQEIRKKKEEEMKYDELNLWELKASIANDWKDDALSQVALYALMTGKIWSRLTLLNPFRNEKSQYYFNSKNIISLRKLVTNDIIVWNTNCYLSKTYNPKNKKTFNVDKKLFVHVNKNEEGDITQFSVLNMLSPTKIRLIYDIYFKMEKSKEKLKYTSQEKLRLESTYENPVETIKEFLSRSVYSKCEIWYVGNNEIDDIHGKKMSELFSNEIEDISQEMEYTKNPDLRYSLDFDDSVVQNLCFISRLSNEYKFL